MTELVITHGGVRRGRRPVLQANSVRVVLPGALAVAGVNGSGKSSLFMCLTGTLAGRAARILIDGRKPSLAYVPQDAALPGWLNAEQAARLYGLDFASLRDRMPRLYLDELGRQSCGRLSTGQRQALAIAIALGRDADLTLLDEPFSGLDFRRRAGVLELLRRRTRVPGRGLVLSSQSADDLREIGSHYLVLRGGVCVFNGSSAALTGEASDSSAVERRLLELLD